MKQPEPAKSTNFSSDEICTRPEHPTVNNCPSAMPIYPAAVYQCDSTEQAGNLLTGAEVGFVYQRDGHPNAVLLSEQLRMLHGGDELDLTFAAITSTGMSALSLAMVSILQSGDHVVVSDQIYGRSTRLLAEEMSRWNVQHTEVDMCDLDQVRAACRPETRMMLVETIANPLLHIANIKELSKIARNCGAKLVVDNTFATPLLYQPIRDGADLVMESATKILNGHGDVMMGVLVGSSELQERIQVALSSYGMTASPFDCWLASRGLATAHLRIDRACQNADILARALQQHSQISSVYYPALESHPSFADWKQDWGEQAGHVVTIELKGGLKAVNRLVAASKSIRFFPSLGEVATTISHPRSTSHRGMPGKQADSRGITEGIVRISCGCESPEFLVKEFEEILQALD